MDTNPKERKRENKTKNTASTDGLSREVSFNEVGNGERQSWSLEFDPGVDMNLLAKDTVMDP